MLDRPQRHAGGRHASAKGVAQLVEGDLAHLGELDRLLEPPGELRAVQGPPDSAILAIDRHKNFVALIEIERAQTRVERYDRPLKSDKP